MSISAAEYLRRIQTVRKIGVLQGLAYDTIIKEETTLKYLKEQDFLGGDIYGNGTLLSYRSIGYEMFKEAKNPRAGGAVDLILTGAFVEAMFVKKPQGNVYSFGNTDSKRGFLVSKYGTGIFGLNQYVFDRFQREILAPRFVRLLKNTARIG